MSLPRTLLRICPWGTLPLSDCVPMWLDPPMARPRWGLLITANVPLSDVALGPCNAPLGPLPVAASTNGLSIHSFPPNFSLADSPHKFPLADSFNCSQPALSGTDRPSALKETKHFATHRTLADHCSLLLARLSSQPAQSGSPGKFNCLFLGDSQIIVPKSARQGFQTRRTLHKSAPGEPLPLSDCAWPRHHGRPFDDHINGFAAQTLLIWVHTVPKSARKASRIPSSRSLSLQPMPPLRTCLFSLPVRRLIMICPSNSQLPLAF